MKEWKAEKLMRGALIPVGGTARQYKTGGWRSEHPVWDEKACKQCLLCWIYCPDGSIKVRDEKVIGIDYDYCKGCGICANECPADAIKMAEGGEPNG